MKKCIVLLTLFQLFFHGINAQTEAITVNGDTVLLFDDGRWDYKNNQAAGATEIEEAPAPPPLNPEKFTKPKTSKAVARGKNGAYELWYNAKKWDRSIKKTGEGSDIELNQKETEGFVMTIFERADFPLNSLRDLALNNARKASTAFEVLGEEMREVNGRQVLCLKFNATIQGVKFTYLGYYCTFPGGTLQLLTMTYQNLFEELKPDFEDLLNGLIIKE